MELTNKEKTLQTTNTKEPILVSLATKPLDIKEDQKSSSLKKPPMVFVRIIIIIVKCII